MQTLSINQKELNKKLQQIERLLQFYQGRNLSEILQFLTENSSLLAVLEEGRNKINHYFPNTPVFLAYIPDPEINQSYLVVYLARNIKDTETAIDNLENLSDNWLDNYNIEVRSKILIRFDYQ